MDFKQLLLSSDGRISRQPYWIATLILVGGNILANFIPVVGTIATLVSIYFYACIYAKRLHDLGVSGWWQLPAWIGWVSAAIGAAIMIIPTIIALIRGSSDDEALLAILLGSGAMLGLAALAVLIAAGFHVLLGLLPGKPGPNRYGPDPLNPHDIVVL